MAPQLATLPALEMAESRLGLAIQLSSSALLEALNKAVDPVIAEEERRPIGAPGLVSYRVTRTPFRLTQAADTLTLATSLNGEVHVCKPFGRACLTYGACQPHWEFELRVPRTFETLNDLEPHAHLALTEGCVLRPVGFNATSEVQKISQREEEKINQRVQREFKRAVREVNNAWLGSANLSYAGIKLQPQTKAFAYRPIGLIGDKLTATVEWRGQLVASALPVPDSSTPGTSGPTTAPNSKLSAEPWIPDADQVPALKGIVHTAMPYAQIAEQLTAAWRTQPEAAAGDVQVITALRTGLPQLYVGLPTRERCPLMWFRVTAELMTAPKQVPTGEGRLRLIIPMASQPPDSEAAARWLAQQVIRVPQFVDAHTATELATQGLHELQHLVKRELRDVRLELRTEPVHSSTRVALSRAELVLVTTMTSQATLTSK